jgi:hypothetical protein
VRGGTGGILIRLPRALRLPAELRLGRLSLALLAAVSTASTIVILESDHGRSPAQLAALAALRERRIVTTAAAPPPVSRPPTSSSSGAGSATSADSGGGSTAASTPSAAGGASGSAAATSAGASSGASASSATSGSSSAPGPSSPTTVAALLPRGAHVFEISLTAPSFAAAFGPDSPASYLRSLVGRGTLLAGYRSLGSGELADELAMISGQAPNADTAAGCQTYAEFPTATVAAQNGTVSGKGCVYPETALTIGDQVSAKGKVWKAFIEDMGATACAHPNSDAADNGPPTGAGAGYDTRHNPFIYFHSLLDLGDCANDDVDLTHLPAAVKSASGAPMFSFLAPGACADGAAQAAPADTSTTSTTSASTTSTSTTSSATTTSASASATSSASSSAPATGTGAGSSGCAAGAPVGVAAEDGFLKAWVPAILGSPAYRHDGVLIIAFSATGAARGAAARTGALVLGHSVRRGRRLARSYTPYSLLRSVEDMLGFTPLAHAAKAPSFAKDVLGINQHERNR